MRVKAMVNGAKDGRRYWTVIGSIELAEGEWLEEITVSTEYGILANIPLQLRSGVPWPPLPMQDLSLLSQDYKRRIGLL